MPNPNGIHVTTLDPVSVYGLNSQSQTTDAFTALPTSSLGREYLALSYTDVANFLFGRLGIVGVHADTEVTWTPFGSSQTSSTTLQPGEVELINVQNGDISGTKVSADKEVAVFASHDCVSVPLEYSACDHLSEQLPPVSAWGTQFLSVPLATRTRGDTFRILASEDDTTISINGEDVAVLQSGEFHETIIETLAEMSSNKPVLVAQYSNGQEYDGTISDPFMMLIPPFEQFLSAYVFSTPGSGIRTNFVNVIAPLDAISEVVLDGAQLPSTSFSPIGDSGFAGAQIPISVGAHSLTAPLPIGAFVYGFDDFDSYGYPGGMSLAPVAEVSSLTLGVNQFDHIIGEEVFATATVVDASGQALAGIRVDFDVAGANPNTGFAFTDENGQALIRMLDSKSEATLSPPRSGRTPTVSLWLGRQPVRCLR